MSERAPTENEWANWLSLPETAWFRRVAASRKQILMESWAAGAFNDDPGLNAKAIGECQAWARMEDMDYQTVVEGELDHDEQQPGVSDE